MSHKNRRKPQAKRKEKRQPASTWILLGALGGVLISSALFIKLTNDSSERPEQLAKVHTKSQDRSAQAAKEPTQPEQPRFHFYTMLQNMQQQKEDAAPPPPQVRPQTLALKPTDLPIYHIQVGSFRKKDDASKLKAQLILNGYDVQLDQVKVQHDTWYRVQIGPFASKQIAHEKQKDLEEQKIHGTLILKKDA